MFDGKFHPLPLPQGLLIANVRKIQNKLPNNSSEHQSRVKATVDNRNSVHFSYVRKSSQTFVIGVQAPPP